MQIGSGRLRLAGLCLFVFVLSWVIVASLHFAVSIRFQDAIFLVGWSMLDAARIQQRLDAESRLVKSSSALQLQNLDFYYSNVLSQYQSHPSFYKLSVAYRDFLYANGHSASPSALKLFEAIGEKKDRRGLFYRDFFNPDMW
jgi:hypothetical protein